MEFDQEGNLVQAWGGPGQGYDWFENEHGITVDHKGFIWVGGNGSAWWLGIWPDARQSYLLNADGENNEVRTLLRDTGEVLGSFGRSGRGAGDFHWVHNLAIDSKGNVFTTEVDNGKRAQKFRHLGEIAR
jgi:hypothetical protein